MKVTIELSDEQVEQLRQMNELSERIHGGDYKWTVTGRVCAIANNAIKDEIRFRLPQLKDILRDAQSKVAK